MEAEGAHTRITPAAIEQALRVLVTFLGGLRLEAASDEHLVIRGSPFAKSSPCLHNRFQRLAILCRRKLFAFSLKLAFAAQRVIS